MSGRMAEADILSLGVGLSNNTWTTGWIAAPFAISKLVGDGADLGQDLVGAEVFDEELLVRPWS